MTVLVCVANNRRQLQSQSSRPYPRSNKGVVGPGTADGPPICDLIWIPGDLEISARSRDPDDLAIPWYYYPATRFFLGSFGLLLSLWSLSLLSAKNGTRKTRPPVVNGQKQTDPQTVPSPLVPSIDSRARHASEAMSTPASVLLLKVMSAKVVLILFVVMAMLLPPPAVSSQVPTGPIAFNQLVLVDASSNAVIRLRGYDTTGLPVRVWPRDGVMVTVDC